MIIMLLLIFVQYIFRKTCSPTTHLEMLQANSMFFLTNKFIIFFSKLNNKWVKEEHCSIRRQYLIFIQTQKLRFVFFSYTFYDVETWDVVSFFLRIVCSSFIGENTFFWKHFIIIINLYLFIIIKYFWRN